MAARPASRGQWQRADEAVYDADLLSDNPSQIMCTGGRPPHSHGIEAPGDRWTPSPHIPSPESEGSATGSARRGSYISGAVASPQISGEDDGPVINLRHMSGLKHPNFAEILFDDLHFAYAEAVIPELLRPRWSLDKRRDNDRPTRVAQPVQRKVCGTEFIFMLE